MRKVIAFYSSTLMNPNKGVASHAQQQLVRCAGNRVRLLE